MIDFSAMPDHQFVSTETGAGCHDSVGYGGPLGGEVFLLTAPSIEPPMVNINPGGRVPRVNVSRMPDIRIQPIGRASRTNFETRIGGSITGPIVVTFLSLGTGVEMSLGSGGQSAADGLPVETALLATAIYLGRGETLRFSQPVLYSGCRPA